MGMERTPNKSQHTKLTLEKKILPPLLPGFELATFDHESGALTSKLSRFAVMIHSTTCFGAYLYLVGTQHGNPHRLSLTMNRMTHFILRTHTGGLHQQQLQQNKQTKNKKTRETFRKKMDLNIREGKN